MALPESGKKSGAAPADARHMSGPPSAQLWCQLMVETAARLVDHVLPHRSVRQWVLSFPHPLRFVLANHPRVMGKV